MDFHPIANVFPLMQGEDYTRLVDDIRKHGLLEPIITHEGMILDGRNRARACRDASVAPVYQAWQSKGESAAEFVWSKNAERRQLTTGQKAMAAQALMPFLEAEAKERQLSTLKRGSDLPVSTNSDQRGDPAQRPPNPGNAGKAAQHAASLAGVGATAIYDAKRLAEQAAIDARAADLKRQVEAGEITLNRATLTMKAAAKPERKVLTMATPAASVQEEEDTDDSAPIADGTTITMLVRLMSAFRRDVRQALGMPVPSQEAMEAWWEGVEEREWEQFKELQRWFRMDFSEPFKEFMHWRPYSRPPMVKGIAKAEGKKLPSLKPPA